MSWFCLHHSSKEDKIFEPLNFLDQPWETVCTDLSLVIELSTCYSESVIQITNDVTP